MPIYTVQVRYGLWVVRAENEDDARRVVFEGPSLDGHTLAASEYGYDFDPEAPVELVEPEGDRGIIDGHFG